MEDAETQPEKIVPLAICTTSSFDGMEGVSPTMHMRFMLWSGLGGVLE